MATFNKSDLVYTYSWTAVAGDDPKISGEPDSTLFNKHEGYEVVYMINSCMEKWAVSTMSDGQKMERLIHSVLPADVRSQKNVYDWLTKNYNTYSV